MRYILSLLIYVGVTSGCTHQGSPVSHISNTELLKQIEAGQAPAIIDVRSTWEYNKGHVPGAVHIPFWSVSFKRDALPGTPDGSVVLYCEHGPRAGIARFALRNAQYNKIYYLRGHMAQWRKDGLPVEGK